MEQGYFSFTLNGTEKIDHSCAKNNNNLDIELTYFTKINPKWIMDLSVKCKTTKILEDNTGENLETMCMVMAFSKQHQRYNP